MEFSFSIQNSHTYFFILIHNDVMKVSMSQYFYGLSYIFMAQNGKKSENMKISRNNYTGHITLRWVCVLVTDLKGNLAHNLMDLYFLCLSFHLEIYNMLKTNCIGNTG